MAYENNNNSGSLFKNDRKQNDRQPDYTGNAIVNGKTMRISAWVRTSRDGSRKFMSLAFEEVQAQAPAPAPTPAPAPRPAPAPAPAEDPDLPF